ncbi:MAG: hypothetical protein IIB61_03520, partial [Planctomycetes bacterium]|nr:hypothetical protein [Planctomycetota bacterium]
MSASGYTKITVAAAKALAGEAMADFSVFLPNSGGEAPVLYHEGGAGMTRPDFDRLDRQGVTDLCVRDEDVAKCDRVL